MILDTIAIIWHLCYIDCPNMIGMQHMLDKTLDKILLAQDVGSRRFTEKRIGTCARRK